MQNSIWLVRHHDYIYFNGLKNRKTKSWELDSDEDSKLKYIISANALGVAFVELLLSHHSERVSEWQILD